MPLFPAMSNVRNVVVKRPSPLGIGSKKSYDVLHDGLRAYFEERSELVSKQEGSTRIVTGTVLLPARDLRSAVVDVQGGDVIEFDDYRGVRQSRTVVCVTPEHDHLQRLDHVVVEVE